MSKFVKKLPDFVLKVDLLIDKEILVLVGPSGSGKTTVLECISGLQKPDWGEIILGEKILFSSSKRINLPYKILKQFNISHLAERYPVQLSGGERQRVAMARTLITKPHLLLLDEPLSAMDRKLRERLRKEIKELHKQWNIPFVLVTHCRCEAELGDKVFKAEKDEDKGETIMRFCQSA
ncbi:ATP-binding cassette domain-containing protein [Thermoanaerobacterium thermosaccharolyticum]|uniref:ATP-binding cassette domain-containing protein n=1 Tax=Thermoanaerobacterium thermosaccharolyticum TaxID=1517 RepID=UPI002FD9BCC6